MTKLIINAIINCYSNPSAGQRFDKVFGEYQRRVNAACQEMPDDGELGCIYLQFQFDGEWTESVKGPKIGRYSRRHNDIQAYTPVCLKEIESKNDAELEQLLSTKLIAVLDAVREQLGNIPHTIPALAETVRSLPSPNSIDKLP